MTGSNLGKALLMGLAALLFFLPVLLGSVLTATGAIDFDGTREEYEHTLGILTMISAGLFLLVGIPFVFPWIWNHGISDRALLRRGTPLEGTLVKLETGAKTVLQIEIREKDGTRYLTLPFEEEVPGRAAGLIREGMTLPLRVDPGDRYHFRVDWEELSFRDHVASR